MTDHKVRHQHDRAVRELQGVVMLRGLVAVDLPKAGETLADATTKQQTFGIRVGLEHDLGTRTQANGSRRICR